MKHFVNLMAAVIVLLTFLYLFLITFVPIPESGQDHAKVIEGFLLGTALATLVAYYWGTSKGSRDKTDSLNRTLDQLLLKLNERQP